PGIASRLAGQRNRVEAPNLFAGLGVVGADEALLPAVLLATAQALDQLAFHGDRSAGGGVLVLGAVADNGLPDHFAVARIESDQVRFAAGHVDVVAVDRDAAHGRRTGVRTVAILPDQLAGPGIQCLQHLSGVVH